MLRPVECPNDAGRVKSPESGSKQREETENLQQSGQWWEEMSGPGNVFVGIKPGKGIGEERIVGRSVCRVARRVGLLLLFDRWVAQSQADGAADHHSQQDHGGQGFGQQEQAGRGISGRKRTIADGGDGAHGRLQSGREGVGVGGSAFSEGGREFGGAIQPCGEGEDGIPEDEFDVAHQGEQDDAAVGVMIAQSNTDGIRPEGGQIAGIEQHIEAADSSEGGDEVRDGEKRAVARTNWRALRGLHQEMQPGVGSDRQEEQDCIGRVHHGAFSVDVGFGRLGAKQRPAPERQILPPDDTKRIHQRQKPPPCGGRFKRISNVVIHEWPREIWIAI